METANADNKRTENALRKSNQKLEAIIAASPDGLGMASLDGKLQLVSEKLAEMYGYTIDEKDDFIGKSVFDFVHPSQHNMLTDNIRLMISGKLSQKNSEYLAVKKDGSSFLTELNSSILLDNNGKPESIIYVQRDITERKLAEHNLLTAKVSAQESEKKFKEIIQMQSEGIGFVDQNEIFEFANPAAAMLFDVAPDGLTGISLFDFLSPHEIEKTKQQTGKRQSGISESYELHIITKKGNAKDILVSSSPKFDENNNYLGAFGVFRDITERKLAEMKLAKSEERFSQVVGQSQGVVWETDATGLYTYVSPLAVVIYGYAPEQMIGKMHFYDLCPQNQREQLRKGADEVFNRRDAFKDFINTIIRSDGSEVILSTNGLPVLDEKGDLLGYRGVDVDITDRIQTEKKLINSELELNGAQEIAKMGSWELNMISGETMRSRSYHLLLGLDPDEKEIPKDYFRKIVHTDDVHLLDEKLEEMYKTRKPTSFDMRIIVPDGSIKWVQNSIVPVFDGDALVGLKGVNIDITDKKQTENEIQELNKNLELKIKERTAQLSVINDNLQKEIEERNKAAIEREEALSRLQKIASRLPGLVYQYRLHPDGTSCFPYASEGIADICRVTPEEVVEDASILFSRVHPDDLEGVVASIQTSAKDLTLWRHEFRIKLDDGVVIWLLGNAMPEKEADGSTLWHGFISDITSYKQADYLVTQTRQNYATFFNTIDDFLFVLDASGNMIHINTTVTERLEYASSELFGKSVLMVHPGERREEAGRIVGEMLAGTADFCPVPLITKSGNYIPVETRVKAGFWDGEPAIFGVSKDISKIKLSEEKFSKAFQSNSALMAISTIEGRFLDVNDAFLHTLNFSRQEVIGSTVDDLNLISFSDFMALLAEKTIQNIPVREIELEVRRKDGSIIIGLFSADKITIGKDECLLTMMVDITERKRAETELRKARTEAEKANLAKSEFLSRMSHELRTPMNSILGFAQLMQMGELSQAQKKGVNHILTSGTHLLNLINEVLDISRIEAGRLTLSLEPVQASSVILEMIDVVQPHGAKRNLKIEMEQSPACQLFIKADRQRLKQVLLNLINNAVKYNKDGGSVLIKAELRKDLTRAINTLRISVADTGIGIVPDDLKKLFLPFERIGAEKSETEGTGLGLTVVKKLMDAMGGVTGVESIPGEGSVFWIELPESQSQKKQQIRVTDDPENTSATVPKSGVILYIEDNLPNAELVEDIIQNHRPGISLITSPTGKYAVMDALNFRPDLILLDLDLPDVHGSKVLADLQENASTRHIPVVIISADAMPQQVAKLMTAGARDYLTKPLDIIGFLQMVDEYFG